MEDPIVSDVIIENSAGAGSIVHGHTMVGAGKKDDPLDVNPNLSLDSLSLNALEIVRPDTGTQFRPLVLKSRDYSLVVRYLWGNFWAIEFGDGKGYRLTNNGFCPSHSNEKDLGTSSQSWRKIYVDEIARGGDSFALPEHTGTLATIESVDNRLENYVKLTGEDSILPNSPYFGQVIIWNGNQQFPAGQMLQFRQNWYYEVINNSGDGWIDFEMEQFVKGAYFAGDNVYEVETEDGETWKIVGPEEEITVDKSFLANFGISYTYNGGLLTMTIHVHEGDGMWSQIGYNEFEFQSLKNRVAILETQIVDVNNQIGNIAMMLDYVNGESV